MTEIKLKANFGRLNTYDKVIVEVGLTVPDPTMLQLELSYRYRRKCFMWSKARNILELHAMWFVEPVSITHLFDEEKGHVFLDSANVVIEMGSLTDFWKWENFAYSSVETRIVF